MKTVNFFCFISVIIFLIPACSPESSAVKTAETMQANFSDIPVNFPELSSLVLKEQTFQESSEFLLAMEQIAEIERSGSYFQGLGMLESVLREDSGDLIGALISAYKELSWPYGFGGISESKIDEGITRLKSEIEKTGDISLLSVVEGIIAFHNESWNHASEILRRFPPLYDEPDSYYQWMLLVCALESGNNSAVRSAYGSIRARYSKLPDYWYRGARTFDSERSAIYAENCINLNPGSPFSAECRKILANFHGIAVNGEAIRTIAEIEDVISRSVAESNPEILAGLFPLMNLPDNDNTQYALGAMKSLAAVPVYRDYFLNQSALQSGRLAERLAYITRG